MALPNMGLPNDLYSYATELYKAISPYVLQGPENAAALERAKVAAAAQTASSRISSQGGIAQANIGAKSAMEQLLPSLALQQQLAEQQRSFELANMFGSGQLRDNLAGLFAMRGQGEMPAVGSAFQGGMPDFSNAFGGPLAYLPGVRAQVGGTPASGGGTSGGIPQGMGGARPAQNYPSYQNAIPSYSAAAGFDAPNRPSRPSAGAQRTGYNLLTGDRQLMTTGRPSGNEEIIRVGPGNQIRDVQPMPFAGASQNLQPFTDALSRTGGQYGGGTGGVLGRGRTWASTGAARPVGRYVPTPQAGTGTAGNQPFGTPYGDDVVATEIAPPILYGNDSVVTEIPQSSPGNLRANLGQVAGLTPDNNMTAQTALAMLIRDMQRQSQPTYSAASGFTTDTAKRLFGDNSLPNSGQLSTLPSMGDLKLNSPRTQLPAPQPAYTAPAVPQQREYDVNNLPILQALRSNTALPAFQAFGGPINLNEVGISEFPNPFQGASTFMRSAEPERQQLLDLWTAAGINPLIALSMIQNATPGYRANAGSALSYA